MNEKVDQDARDRDSKFSFMLENLGKYLTLFIVFAWWSFRSLRLLLTKENSNFTQEQTEFIHTYFITKYKCGWVLNFCSLPEKKQNVYKDKKEILTIEWLQKSVFNNND